MSPRGRPRRMRQLELPGLENPNNVEGEIKTMSEMNIKHLVRGINKQGVWGEAGDKPLEVVEKEINEYLAVGYKLNYVTMIANDNNFINLLYILTKE